MWVQVIIGSILHFYIQNTNTYYLICTQIMCGEVLLAGNACNKWFFYLVATTALSLILEIQ